MEEQSFLSFMGNNLADFWEYTGFAQATGQHLIMILVGLFFLWLAIKKNFEPLLLVPIGFGILIGNIPFKADAGLEIEHPLSRCKDRLVSSIGIPWHWCHDRLLCFDF